MSFNKAMFEKIGTNRFMAKPLWLTWATCEVELEVGEMFSVFQNGSVRIGGRVYGPETQIEVGVGPGRFLRNPGSRVLTYDSSVETRFFALKYVKSEGWAWVELIPMA